VSGGGDGDGRGLGDSLELRQAAMPGAYSNEPWMVRTSLSVRVVAGTGEKLMVAAIFPFADCKYGFSSLPVVCSCTEVAPAAGGEGSVAITASGRIVPAVTLMVAPEMNEMSPVLSVASMRAALSVMLETLLTSDDRGPRICDELKLPVTLEGPLPPA
jgi:hypothetical protein